MFATFRAARKAPLAVLRPAAALLLALAVASCAPIGLTRGGDGPRIDPSQPVQVAMLVPSSDATGAAGVASSLANAARLAVSDLDGARIDLRVYDTAGNPARAAEVARGAVDDGARIVIGPLFTQTTAAVTAALADRDVTILSFSNNAALGGGNVFVLGRTFDTVAQRLAGYAASQGRGTAAVFHASDVAGQAGREAIVAAARGAGMRVAAVEGYALSQQGIEEAAPRIAAALGASGSDTLFLTANVGADLPLVAAALSEAGVSPSRTRLVGLTQWDSVAEALAIPALEGGLFALPDQSTQAAFSARYRAAYGADPHPLAGLGYDAVQAIGSLVAEGRADALTPRALAQPRGFAGAQGAFRLLPGGSAERALAVAQVRGGRAVVVDPAPRQFGRAGL